VGKLMHIDTCIFEECKIVTILVYDNPYIYTYDTDFVIGSNDCVNTLLGTTIV
jgi:hypothetical protein